METPPGTTTAAGGTHPTGMHSCDINLILVGGRLISMMSMIYA